MVGSNIKKAKNCLTSQIKIKNKISKMYYIEFPGSTFYDTSLSCEIMWSKYHIQKKEAKGRNGRFWLPQHVWTWRTLSSSWTCSCNILTVFCLHNIFELSPPTVLEFRWAKAMLFSAKMLNECKKVTGDHLRNTWTSTAQTV